MNTNNPTPEKEKKIPYLMRMCKNCGLPNFMHGVIEINTYTGEMRLACEYASKGVWKNVLKK